MKKLIIAASVLSILFGCSSSEAPVPKKICETEKTGSIKILNKYYTDPYAIYLDGNYISVVSGSGTEMIDKIKEGSHVIKFVQESGYFFSATVIQNTVTVVQCSTLEIAFRK